MQRGLVARASDVTLSGAAHKPTPQGRAEFTLWTALLVDHDAMASLTPRASPQTKFGSVTVCKGGRLWVSPLDKPCALRKANFIARLNCEGLIWLACLKV